MVSRNAGDPQPDRIMRVPARTELDETKASFQTTELWVFVAAVVGVLVATQQLDNMDGWDGWRLVTILATGYLVSRGLAKAGSRHRDEG
jgi:hypothetical protein